MCSLLPSGFLALRSCIFSFTLLLARNCKICMNMYSYEDAVPCVGDSTKANLRTAPFSQKFVEGGTQGEGAMLASCWVCGGVEDRALFESHGAAARREPSTDPVSNSWRRFPSTAERITAAWTVKGNEERAQRLEKIGRRMTHETTFLPSPAPACSHGAVTHPLPETRWDADPAGWRCSIRGDNQERGLVGRCGAAGRECGRV